MARTPEDAHRVTEQCCAGGSHSSGRDTEILTDTLHFSMVGQAAGCRQRQLLPSMHCSPPTPLHRLTEFWFDRYENNFKKSHHLYSKPTADGFVLFDRKGQRNHSSTVAKTPISTESALYPNGETLSARGAGGAMGSSSRCPDLRSPHLHILQSLGLAFAESVWWPGSPCPVQCCRRGEWAAEHFQAHP